MIIYICSRFSANTKEQFNLQLDLTKSISKKVVLAGHEVIVPHLYYPQFLDDNDEQDRLIGTQSAIKLLDVCDALFVAIELKVSKGMEAEIKAAKQKQISIYYFRNMNELRDILKRVEKQNEKSIK